MHTIINALNVVSSKGQDQKPYSISISPVSIWNLTYLCYMKNWLLENYTLLSRTTKTSVQIFSLTGLKTQYSSTEVKLLIFQAFCCLHLLSLPTPTYIKSWCSDYLYRLPLSPLSPAIAYTLNNILDTNHLFIWVTQKSSTSFTVLNV